jgi:hypothetical protein
VKLRDWLVVALLAASFVAILVWAIHSSGLAHPDTPTPTVGCVPCFPHR